MTLAEAHAVVAQLCHHSNLERETHARQAIELLGQQAHPDPRILSAALVGLAMAHHHTGRGVPHQVLAKAIELEECAADRPPVTWRARSNLGLFLKWADDFEGARPILMAMCQDAADEGDESSLPDLLEQLAELELWAGDWKRAARYANECVEAAQWTGQAVVISLNRCVRGLVNAHLGLADQARSDAQAGLAFAEERADPWVAGWGWRVLGFLELSLGRLADASQNLSRADAVAESIGLREPGQWRFHADHLEALIGLGELGRAAELLARFEEQARAAGRPWALATSARSRALLLAARHNPDGAAAAIEQALAHHQRLAMPFELGRTLLTQGQLRRRAKQKRTARESLQQALQIFEQLSVGCPGPSGLRILIGSSPERTDHVAGKYRKFTSEFREEAARMVVETSRPIADVARELGINETSLGNWVRAYRENHAGDEPPLQLSERARLRELEREVRELRMKADFLSKAAAYFAAEHR